MESLGSGGFDLRQFLEECREQGEAVGEGAFTVMESKALDKLARFALPGEHDWALKVVQAVNCWNCSHLRVHQTRVATTFYFCPPADRFPTEASVIETLRRHHSSQSEAERELALALRALVDQAGLSFVLSIRRNGQTAEPIFSGVDVSNLSARERRNWAELKQDGLRLTVSHLKEGESFLGRYLPTFSLVADRQTAIFSVLAERAFTSAAAITIDGLAITNPFLQPLVAKRHLRPIALGWKAVAGGQRGRVVLPLTEDERRFQRPRLLDGLEADWFLLRTADWRALVVGASGPADSHHLFYLKHGVICRRETLPNSSSATTLFVVLSCDDAQTDISGLVLSEEHAVEEKRVKTLQWLLPEIEELPVRVETLVDSDAEGRLGDGGGSEDEGRGVSFLSRDILPKLESTEALDKPISQLLLELKENLSTTLARPWRARYLKAWRDLFEDECGRVGHDLRVRVVSQ